MALLSAQDLIDLWADWMRQNRETITITKTDLKAAVDATDQWVSDNSVSYNNALPAAAKAGLSSPQKASLLSYVLAKRYSSGV